MEIYGDYRDTVLKGMKGKKIAVVGHRKFTDYERLQDVLDEVYPDIEMIVTGGAPGADSLAEQYARERGIDITIFRPKWTTHGKAAGAVRNQKIVDMADCLIAFWDGESKGTKISIEMAKKSTKPFIVDVLDLYKEDRRK